MTNDQPFTVGRYLLHRKIARGGMATIHIARLMGDVGFSRIVAAKRLHPELAEDSEFVAMFLDEARIASKVHHRNVVPVLDVVTMGEEAVLVQEYVHGAPLSLLLRNSCEAKAHVPIPVAASIACQVLAGLHAAHETLDEIGTPLHIVHRDVSPQNVMVANDGTARLLDFGVAKASLTAHVTRKGTFKGKLGYSSPEQIRGEATRQSDIYSLGVVLWELLVGHRLHGNVQGEAQLIAEIMAGRLPTITDALAEERSWIGSYRWSQLEALEPIIRKALDVQARRRWTTAADMEEAIAAAVPIASSTDVAAWLKAVGKEFLEDREKMIAEEEASWRRTAATLALAAQAPPVEIPTTTATEPENIISLTGTFFRRGPTAIIGLLIVLLSVSVAFLMRDLETASPPPQPAQAHTGPPPVMRPAVVRAVVPLPELTAAPEPPRHAAIVAPASSESTEIESAEPVAERAAHASVRWLAPSPAPPIVTRPIVQKPAPRPVIRRVRATPARAAQPMRPVPPPAMPKQLPPPPAKQSVALDCSTPFYFEGRKKIFKPGCL